MALVHPVAETSCQRAAAASSSRPGLADHVLLLYTGSRDDVNQVVSRCYATSAIFEDPLVSTNGNSSVSAYFCALKAVFANVSVHGVTVSQEPGRLVLRCTLAYHLTRLFGTLHIPQTTTLMINDSGVIYLHRDDWHHPLGVLMRLPWPLSIPSDVCRKASGYFAMVFAGVVWTLVDAVLALTWNSAALVCSYLDSVIAFVLGTELSMLGVLCSLFDVRGAGLLTAAASSGHSVATERAGLNGAVAVLVSDFSVIPFCIAGQLARAGAASLHLVGPSEERLAEVAEQLQAEVDGCNLVLHSINFLHPGDVVEWCRATCRLLSSQLKQVDLLVLCSVAVVPQEDRFTLDALDQSFTADVVSLQALLKGLRPALSPGARVVVTASATCNWLSRPSHKALRSGTVVDALGALLARSQQQAARVVVASHQARLWATEGEGPICVSCTPSGCWSAWTDLLAWAGLLDMLRSLIHSVLRCEQSVDSVRGRIAEQMASAVVHLCGNTSFVTPGEYYWGAWRIGGLGSSILKKVDDADIGKMFLALALRSGQLPG